MHKLCTNRPTEATIGPTTADAFRHPVTVMTPAGDVSIVLLESDDLAASLFGVATSIDVFDVWFRAHVQQMHGIDLAVG